VGPRGGEEPIDAAGTTGVEGSDRVSDSAGTDPFILSIPGPVYCESSATREVLRMRLVVGEQASGATQTLFDGRIDIIVSYTAVPG
jgi:hypothetical protein